VGPRNACFEHADAFSVHPDGKTFFSFGRNEFQIGGPPPERTTCMSGHWTIEDASANETFSRRVAEVESATSLSVPHWGPRRRSI
jgi:hypothetical protein